MSQFEWAQTFKAIVDNQSFVKTAQQIGTNSSAVSKQLAKLEASLGVQLLQRTTRSLALTEAGMDFYEKTTRIQHEWKAALDEAGSLGADLKGCLRIAAPQPLLSRFLMPFLSDFQRQFPSISFELLHSQLDLIPLINADVSISRELVDYDSSTMAMVPFFSYHNRLFASPDYLKQYPPIAFMSQLKEHNCLVYENRKHKAQWEFESSSVALDRITVVNNAEIMISAAKAGMGLIYLPKEIILEELEQQKLVQVLPELKSQRFKTCAYYNKVNFVPKKVRALTDFLKESKIGLIP